MLITWSAPNLAYGSRTGVFHILDRSLALPTGRPLFRKWAYALTLSASLQAVTQDWHDSAQRTQIAIFGYFTHSAAQATQVVMHRSALEWLPSKRFLACCSHTVAQSRQSVAQVSMPPFALHSLAHSLQMAAVDEQTFAHSVTSLVIVIVDSRLVGTGRRHTWNDAACSSRV